MVMQNDLLRDVFEADPLGRRGLFESVLPTDVTTTQRAALSSMFEPTFNRFLGQLTQDPTRRFSDFLQTDFNPQRELLRLPSAFTGGGLNTNRTIFNL